MRKLVVLFMLLVLAAPAALATADPYADAVVAAHTSRVVDAANALGEPDGSYATLKGFGFLAQSPAQLVLDMGEGEEIIGGPGPDYDFVVIEVDGCEIPDCASIGVHISGDGLQWVGISCSSDGFVIPDGELARYVMIKNHLGLPYEVDAVVAKHYVGGEEVPEFGTVGAALALLGAAGFVAYRKRR